MPDLWIQRAQLAMQFKRMETALAKRSMRGHADEQIERLKARVAEEYASFSKALEEWAKVRDEWVAEPQAAAAQKLGRDELPAATAPDRGLGLRMQRRRLHAMTKAYA